MHLLSHLAVAAMAVAPLTAIAQNAPITLHDCSAAERTDAPKALISSGDIHAVVYLPDKDNGYYRSTRFDWSGVIGCLSYRGHTYFGPWSPQHDPLINDSISGPVEEFRPTGDAFFYDQAKPGETFIKPGVGVLRRVSEKPYSPYTTYPIVDSGTWTSHATSKGVSFTQELKTDKGFAYTYSKDLQFDPKAPVLILSHSMTNHGSNTIEMDVYNHDFFVLDNAPTGPGIVVHLPFRPVPEKPLQNGGAIEGNDLIYTSELQPRQSVSGFMTGYSDKVSDYHFTVEDTRTGIGVEQTADKPLSRFNFWSIRTTVCPEGYIHLSIAPGQTSRWTIRYPLFRSRKGRVLHLKGVDRMTWGACSSWDDYEVLSVSASAGTGASYSRRSRPVRRMKTVSRLVSVMERSRRP